MSQYSKKKNSTNKYNNQDLHLLHADNIIVMSVLEQNVPVAS